MMILLDLARPQSSHETNTTSSNHDLWVEAQEEAINLAGSLIREAYLHGIHVGLIVAGVPCPSVPMHHNQAHRQRLLDTLAQLDLTNTHAPQMAPPGQPTVIVRPNDPDIQRGEDHSKASILNVSGNGRKTTGIQRAHDRPTSREHQPITPGL